MLCWRFNKCLKKWQSRATFETKTNTPDLIIKGQSPVCTLAFNHKNPDLIVGGCYNGLVALWDLKKNGNKPVDTTMIEKSHHDPV